MEKRIYPQHEAYYDIYDDWNLIEASFLMQYGLRLRSGADDDMSYQEFCSLLSGIMPDTPLGKVVSIRAEKDKKVIKNFTEDQKRIRKEYILKRNRNAMNNMSSYNEYWRGFQYDAKTAFSR